MKLKYLILFPFILLAINTFAGNDDNRLFTLYPLPLLSNNLNAKPTSSITQITTFELRNLVGKKLQEKLLPKGSEEITFNDMDIYPNGLYIVVAKDANGKMLETIKFIINK